MPKRAFKVAVTKLFTNENDWLLIPEELALKLEKAGIIKEINLDEPIGPQLEDLNAKRS